MEVFVVLSHYMQGIQDIGVFSSLDDARNHITNHEIGANPKISKIPVVGDLTTENTVFSASKYEKSTDTHFFQGVYGDYDQASKAAGERGLVLARKL